MPTIKGTDGDTTGEAKATLSVGASYQDALWNFAKANYSTLRQDKLVDLVDGTAGDYGTTSSGVGASVAASQSSGTGGTLAMNSGTNGSAAAAKIFWKGQTATPPIVLAKTGGAWFMAARIAPAYTVTALNQFYIGMFQANLAGVTAIVGVDGPTNTSKFSTNIGAGGWIATSTNLINNVGYYTLAVGFDGTTITFFVGDPQAGTLAAFATSTLISTIGDTTAMPIINIGQAGGTANASNISADSFYMAWA